MTPELLGHRTVQTTSAPVTVDALEPVDRLEPPADGVRRVAHLSDTHYGKPIEGGSAVERFETWLRAFERADADLVAFTGDAVETPDDRVGMLRIRHALEACDLEWVAVPGNHDIARPGAESPYYDIFGPVPRVVRTAGVECVLLDSLAGLAVRERDPFDRLEARRGGSFSKGRVGSRQLGEVAADIGGSGGPRILLVHHHLAPEAEILDDPPVSGAPDALMVPCLDAESVVDWAREHDVSAVFHGHKHAHWPPYVPQDRPVVFNSGSSTRGKPDPRARLVDFRESGPVSVWEFGL